MSDETQQLPDLTGIQDGDILFDCPHCGKNMAIESAGAGLMVPCASCGKPVQVPIPDIGTPDAPVTAALRPAPTGEEDPQATIRQLDSALAMANQTIDRLLAEKEALQERRAFLEQIRITNSMRLKQIATELETVQNALDRTQVLLAEVRAEKPA